MTAADCWADRDALREGIARVIAPGAFALPDPEQEAEYADLYRRIRENARATALAKADSILKLIEAARHSQPGAEGGVGVRKDRADELPIFLDALEEWGCDDTVEQAREILAFLASDKGISQWREECQADKPPPRVRVSADNAKAVQERAREVTRAFLRPSPQQPATSTDEKVES